jgi:uncharacterized protein YbjT (DUF2867 family)
MNLVVGATGMLGGHIARRLIESGKPVRALVRPTAAPAVVKDLNALGIQVVEGDLRDPTSLTRACQGAATVISTATAIGGHQPGDSIPDIDLRGHKSLVDAARGSGVRHLVYTSFSGNLRTPEPCGDSKRAVERYLIDGAVAYTILRPTFYMEGWLSPLLGFDYSNARARIYGAGRNPISWISFRDVAEFAARCVDNPDARGRVIELGGPEALSPLAVVRIFEEVGGHTFAVEHVPKDTLSAQLEQADDDVSKSAIGLMLDYAGGDAKDMTEVLRAFPAQLISVRDYATRVLAP